MRPPETTTRKMQRMAFRERKPIAEVFLEAFIACEGHHRNTAKLLDIGHTTWYAWRAKYWSPPLTDEELRSAWEERL